MGFKMMEGLETNNDLTVPVDNIQKPAINPKPLEKIIVKMLLLNLNNEKMSKLCLEALLELNVLKENNA